MIRERTLWLILVLLFVTAIASSRLLLWDQFALIMGAATLLVAGGVRIRLMSVRRLAVTPPSRRQGDRSELAVPRDIHEPVHAGTSAGSLEADFPDKPTLDSEEPPKHEPTRESSETDALPEEVGDSSELSALTDRAIALLESIAEILPAQHAGAGSETPEAERTRTNTAELQTDASGGPGNEAQTGATGKTEAQLDQNLMERLESSRSRASQMAEQISHAHAMSDNVSKNANEAFQLAERLQQGVEEIDSGLERSLGHARHLTEQSARISEVVAMMSDLSSRIHVLSINASIVSARVGAHGKAFEVVAKEIRNLAQETDRSLTEIDEFLNDLRERIGQTAEETETAGAKTAEEKQALMSVAGSLQGVLLSVEVVNTVTANSRQEAAAQATELESFKEACRTLLDTLERKNAALHDVATRASEYRSLRERMRIVGRRSRHGTERREADGREEGGLEPWGN